jgi:hypothetical protein
MAAYLLLASRLAPKDKVERWLDAFFAIDATRVSLSHYAWLRHLAARWRGDPPSAELWWQRFHDSVTRLTDPARAELWRAAGL